MKNKIENALTISQFVAFMVATILALAFEFSGLETLLICALVLYVIAFGLMTINGCIYLSGKYKALKTVLSAPKTSGNPTDSADTKAENGETNAAQTIEADETDNTNAAVNAENGTAVGTGESSAKEFANNNINNTKLGNTADNAIDDDQSEAALKKQIVTGLVKVSLCAVFCLFSFVCLVLF